jgi:hypothetical protein
MRRMCGTTQRRVWPPPQHALTPVGGALAADAICQHVNLVATLKQVQAWVLIEPGIGQGVQVKARSSCIVKNSMRACGDMSQCKAR